MMCCWRKVWALQTAGLRWGWVALLALTAVACGPWAAVTHVISGPLGDTSKGLLVDGVELPQEGEGYAFYHRRDRRYGSREMASLIVDVGRQVNQRYPGSVVQVGDISGPFGGRILGHSSHRTGLDVDFAFFVRNPKKQNTREFLLALHDPNGVAVAGKEVGYFDLEKNWAVVEALLTSEVAQVQWIFVSKGLKARLLGYALASGKNLEVVSRAAEVLHQPGDSAIHNDHFHVRIFCPAVKNAPGCAQKKPVWPWVNSGTLPPAEGPSDEELRTLALEGLVL